MVETAGSTVVRLDNYRSAPAGDDWSTWESTPLPGPASDAELEEALEVLAPKAELFTSERLVFRGELGEVWVRSTVLFGPPASMPAPVGCDEVSLAVSFSGSVYACVFCDVVVWHDDLGSTRRGSTKARSELSGLLCRDAVAALAHS